MRVSKKSAVSFETKMDMTPLIDCIFQLILFLVLTSQINVQVEEVDLPFALEGKSMEENKEAVPPLLVNVRLARSRTAPGERRGEIVFNGKEYGNDEKKLFEELQREASYDAADPPRGRGRGWEAGPGGKSLSKLAVLVRADRNVAGEYIRTVFMACQKANIYRIRVSAMSPSP